jgi:hypothetical protein
MMRSLHIRNLKIALLFAAVLTAAGADAAGVDAQPLDNAGLAPYAQLFPKGRALRGIAYRGADGSDRAAVLGGDYGPPVLDDKGMNYLYVYGVKQAGAAPQVQWEMKEGGHGILCMMQPLVDLLKVDDPLKSGEPVVLVPYWIGCDGLDPTDVKLIVYYQDHKYAIRGTLPNQEDDEVTQKASDNFKELPPALQKYLWSYWDGVKEEATTAKDAPIQ